MSAALGAGSPLGWLCATIIAEQPATIAPRNTSRQDKLGLHQQGQLMLYALRHGYVLVTPGGVLYLGFRRQLEKIHGAVIAVPTKAPQPEPAGFERRRLFTAPS